MKKVLTLILAVMCLVALIGCGNKQSVVKETTVKTEAAQTETSSEDYIGEAKAKRIALEHADGNTSDAMFNEVALEDEDDRPYYEIRMVAGELEYEFEIDAITGKVLKRSVESIYDL